ncbi:VOC family protein [Paraglaciecola agarilytica]|uniref:VOC family protein n=1 Tax=Paraglaciecola chathamensis TaxID=368405 RepID=UPI001C098DE7|nr:VOC family protein [Paraglaciecola agarilytica]MBU3019803.1 VOC family protein [Paraglaciecola agarilytica]
MFSHVMIGVNDMEASKKFYDATMQVLGYKPGVMDEKGRCFYFDKSGVFALTKPINGEPACHGNGTTLGFKVESTEQAEAWHAAGVANGGVACEDPPGVRGEGENKMHLAYLRDPAGNKICTLIRV